jgi:hypothetical protein
MLIPIDKNVPIPPERKRGGQRKYPFRTMMVGDSFLVKESGERVRLTLGSAASVAGRRLKRTFTVRKTEDGHRVWRTS